MLSVNVKCLFSSSKPGFYVQICWILDFRSGLVEAFARLGCYAVLVGGYRRFDSIFKGQAVFD